MLSIIFADIFTILYKNKKSDLVPDFRGYVLCDVSSAQVEKLLIFAV